MWLKINVCARMDSILKLIMKIVNCVIGHARHVLEVLTANVKLAISVRYLMVHLQPHVLQTAHMNIL